MIFNLVKSETWSSFKCSVRITPEWSQGTPLHASLYVPCTVHVLEGNWFGNWFVWVCTVLTFFSSLSFLSHTLVCTTIVSNQSKPSPSVAFFGQTLPVYIELYGHPIPALQSQPTVRLRYGVTQDVLPDNVTDLFQTVYPSEESSLVVNVFNIQVPNIDSEMYGHIIFSVTFETARGCPTTNSIMYTISVVGLEGNFIRQGLGAVYGSSENRMCVWQ